jgi:hypothetical protein
MTTPDGMPPDALRELVREVLRDVLPGLANGAAPPSGVPATSLAGPSATPPATQATRGAGPIGPIGRDGAAPIGPTRRDGAAPEPIRLATDEELHAFVLRVVALADNPKRRRDLMAGRLRFTLAPAAAAAAWPGDAAAASHIPAAAWPADAAAASHIPAVGRPGDAAAASPTPADHRIEKGAVTERTVQAAASAGARLVLGPRAVLTPLARDRARSLGVPIEKER